MTTKTRCCRPSQRLRGEAGKYRSGRILSLSVIAVDPRLPSPHRSAGARSWQGPRKPVSFGTQLAWKSSTHSSGRRRAPPSDAAPKGRNSMTCNPSTCADRTLRIVHRLCARDASSLRCALISDHRHSRKLAKSRSRTSPSACSRSRTTASSICPSSRVSSRKKASTSLRGSWERTRSRALSAVTSTPAA